LGTQSAAWGPGQPSRRRWLRYPVQAALDVSVLRSGVPETLPGRCVDVSTGGIAAVLAGELSPGESVGVEMRLPMAANPFRARALVRHYDKLRCGMEFVGLSDEQQKAIRESTEKPGKPAAKPGDERRPVAAAPKIPSTSSASSSSSSASLQGGDSGGPKLSPPNWQRGREWIFLLVSVAVLLGVLWWRWNRGWEDIEADLRNKESVQQPEAQVPADVMEKLVRHRVDPDYPLAARSSHLQGVIVLDVVVGTDGSVTSVRPLNGPEVLAQSAVDAMRWWKFEPYRVDGQAVVAETTVAMEFKP
jgi:TonB family protein